MLLFLSDVKTRVNRASQLEISPACYGNIDAKSESLVETTNESAVRYLIQKQGISFDKMFYFATNKVRGKIENPKANLVYKDDAEKEYTHEEYFRKRLNLFYPVTEENLQPVFFDENKPAEETITAVIDMAEKIQEEISSTEEDVYIHADFTGGMRHANIIMLVLMRLLQYNNNVKLGKIVYSNFVPNREVNYVEEANGIYNLFDIIAGAEEFANFGSVKALEKYFENKKKTPSLQKLLDAMRNFSDEIRMTHAGKFSAVAENLRKAFYEFKSEGDSNSRLMLLMRQRMAEEYREILKPEVTALDHISWCLRHDYIQQALTLFNEKIPEVLFDWKILELTEEGEKQVRAYEGEKEKGEIEKVGICYYTVNRYDAYKSEINSEFSKCKTKFFQDIKKFAKELCLKEISLEAAMEKVDKSLEVHGFEWENMDGLKDAFDCFDRWVKDPKLLKDLDDKDVFLQRMIEVLKNKDMYQAFSDDKYGKARLKRLASLFESKGIEEKEYKELFQLSLLPSTHFDNLRFAEKHGVLKMNVSREDRQRLKKILQNGQILKDQRNKCNHGRNDEDVMSADALKILMMQSIDLLRKMKKDGGQEKLSL